MDIKIVLLILLVANVASFITTFTCMKIRNNNATVALLFKIVASLLIVIWALYSWNAMGGAVANMFMVFGFVTALIADILHEFVLSSQENKGLLSLQMGVSSLMSVFYLVAMILIFYPLKNFALFASGAAIIAAILAVVLQLMEEKLKLNFTGFRAQVGVQCFASAFVAVLGLGICFFVLGMAIFAVGAVLILASQIVSYYINFSSPKRKNLLVGFEYGLYYIGQLMIVIYMLFQIV